VVIQISVDVTAMAERMRPAIEFWMTGYIKIVEPEQNSGDFNRFDNSVTGDEPEVVWEGKARIQPLKGDRDSDAGYQEKNIRTVEFQLPYDPAGQGSIRKGQQIIVVDGGEDPTLEGFQYVIQNGINSSGMWTRTVMATSDMSAPEVN